MLLLYRAPPLPLLLVLQLNIANAGAAAMKVYNVDDEKKLAHVYGLRIGQVRRCAGWGAEGVASARRERAAPPSRGGTRRALRSPRFRARPRQRQPARPPLLCRCCSLSAAAAARPASSPASRAARHATTRRAQEVEGDNLDAEQFKGYIFRVTGGNDKQGFPMQQGILSSGRVRLLMGEGSPYFRVRRAGERRRKSIRGCIVAQDIAILNLVIVKHGEAVLPGLTDEAANRPNRLGPKRASKIRKVFNLSKEDDVRKKVITRTFTTKKGKAQSKRPKIQRLVTPVTLQRKRAYLAERKAGRAKAVLERQDYEKLKKVRAGERRDSELKAKAARRSSRKASGVAPALTA